MNNKYIMLALISLLSLISLNSFSNELDTIEDEEKEFLFIKGLFNDKYGIKTELKSKKIESIQVGIVDTGISYLTGSSLMRTVKSIPETNSPLHSHGQHVQGIFFLLSKNQNINHYNFYKSLEKNKQLSFYIESLTESIKNKDRIINLSLNGEETNDEEFDLLVEGTKKGSIFVVAAGNESFNLQKKDSFPTNYLKEFKYLNIISVANFVSKNKIAESSNYSGEVFIGAIGNRVPSYCNEKTHAVCFSSGTSMSTPVITASISLILERYPYLTMQQIKHILSINSDKNKKALQKTKVGVLNPESLISWLNKEYTVQDIFPNRKDLQQKYRENPHQINTKRM